MDVSQDHPFLLLLPLLLLFVLTSAVSQILPELALSLPCGPWLSFVVFSLPPLSPYCRERENMNERMMNE